MVAAHVDSFTQGVGPFAGLLSARPGDRLELGGRNRAQTFAIRSVRLVPKPSLTAGSRAYSAYGRYRLVLITCGGPYDASRGGYQDNLVVVAAPVGPLHGR